MIPPPLEFQVSMAASSTSLPGLLVAAHELSTSGQNWTSWTGIVCQTTAMTTKTIPQYLEDERRNRADTELRTEEEAARIQPLRHGQHRTPKPPKPELPSPVEAVAKARKTAVAKTIKPAAVKARKPVAAARRKPRVARKTGTKVRKMA
jgi:hypothetical protein